MANVTVERTEGVVRVEMDRPPLNVVNIGMMEELEGALASLRGDASVKVIVLAGKGKAFSAGVDIADHTPDRVEAMIGKFHAIFHTLWALEPPVVAAVQGSALGGGCELAVACDLIFASDQAKFGQPEIKVGVFAPVASLLLPRLLPEKKAYELLLTGESIDAREAERLGLVNHVAPPESFAAELNAFVSKLTSLSGAATKHAKRAIRLSLGADRALAGIERLYLDELMRTQDAVEGLNAFMEKRAPVWKDR